jgi:hypothetical protein
MADTEIETAGFVREDVEMEGQRSVGVGRQRWIRHTQNGRQWEHPRTLADDCAACQLNMGLLGREEYLEQMDSEAPLD